MNVKEARPFNLEALVTEGPFWRKQVTQIEREISDADEVLRDLMNGTRKKQEARTALLSSQKSQESPTDSACPPVPPPLPSIQFNKQNFGSLDSALLD